MQINNSNVFSHRMHSHWKRRMGKVNKLTTNRLTIRNFLSDDTEKCLEGWGRDAGLGKYIIGYPMDYSSMDNVHLQKIKMLGLLKKMEVENV